MQTMMLGTELIQGLSDGHLSAAVWPGRHELEPGPIRLQAPDGGVSMEMTVVDVRHKPFAAVDHREARDSGEPDSEALWRVLSAAYGDMTRSDEVTVALLE